MEEFGCVDEARQSANDANGVLNPYRWDLDLIVDRYGNQIRIHYQRNPAAKGIRDAQISSIEYDDPSCHNTSFNGATAQCSSWNPKVKVIFDAATKPAHLTNPDSSYQIDYFASTNGWGIAESSITCFLTNGSSCFAAPYWNPDPGIAGRLKTEQDFSASGALMQVTNNTYSMNCPPTGVSHSGNASGPPNNPGNQYLISELDQNNPVVVCDPRITQEDTYQVDGVTDVNGYQSNARVVHKTVSKSYDGDNQGVSAYDYGNVDTVDTTGNDVGGSHFVQNMTYFPNDNLGSNVYLMDLPAFASKRRWRRKRPSFWDKSRE